MPVAHRVCPWWHAYSFDNMLRRLMHKPQKVLGPYVREGMAVMDVGCGMGHFSIGMARMVGETGRVIAVDVQQQMLDVMLRRAQKAGMADRIEPHRCTEEALGVEDPVDFAVAFWVVHEAPDAAEFLRQIGACLKPGGRLLIAEPRMHVSAKDFAQTVSTAAGIGLRCVEEPHITICRSAVFAAE